MKLAARTTAAAVAAVTTAGVSTLALGVAPAAAAPSDGCGGQNLVAPGVCEQVFTAGGTFTPTAQMTKLEVLLVGGGGTGNNAPASGTNGYASGGGGGEVVYLDATGTAAPITVAIGGTNSPTTLGGGVTDSANGGAFGGYASGTTTATGGSSGSGFAGATNVGDPAYAGGGGAAAAATNQDGGAGVVVSTIVPGGSLFAGDSRCFGGGGAVGIVGVQGVAFPGCGGGAPVDAADGALTEPRANSGGGGGATTTTDSSGASGTAIFRWNAGNVTLSFNANGHGTAPAAQSVVAGTAATQPATPTADNWEFTGWYTDASLTTLADFSAINSSTTFYAGWRSILAVTGSETSPVAWAGGVAAFLAGVGLVTVAAVRRRRAG